MRLVGLLALVVVATAPGCAPWRQPPPVPLENPLAIPASRCDAVWDQIVDVVDDYFDIQSEQRVRQAGDVMTVGRIDTAPRTGATLLEPWRRESADHYETLQNTLQTIRRRAVIQVIPAGEVFQIEAVVYKELEDLPNAEYSTAGQATFRNDDSLIRIEQPVGVQSVTRGWIPLGRDTALEQRMLAQIMERIGPPRDFRGLPPWVHSWTGEDTTVLRPEGELLPPGGESLPPNVILPAPSPEGPSF